MIKNRKQRSLFVSVGCGVGKFELSLGEWWLGREAALVTMGGGWWGPGLGGTTEPAGGKNRTARPELRHTQRLLCPWERTAHLRSQESYTVTLKTAKEEIILQDCRHHFMGKALKQLHQCTVLNPNIITTWPIKELTCQKITRHFSHILSFLLT